MGDTTISWTARPGTKPRTWNPTQGCALKSEGCRNCYAMRQARRFAGPGKPFDGLINLKTGKWTGEARLATHKLTEPLSWRAPSTVFVDSMSDLFYERFTNEEIAAVFGVMAATPQHTYQILTKRATRMRAWFAWADSLPNERDQWAPVVGHMYEYAIKATRGTVNGFRRFFPEWPLPNVWIGVSVENQEAADERIPDLLATPAAIRFLSCEPLLGPVTLHEDGLDWLTSDHCRGIDWVIAGAESGPRARDCNNEWLRSLRDQCGVARVPFFLKQAVAWDAGRDKVIPMGIGCGPGSNEKGRGFGGPVIESPYLDGVQHMEWPQ